MVEWLVAGVVIVDDVIQRQSLHRSFLLPPRPGSLRVSIIYTRLMQDRPRGHNTRPAGRSVVLVQLASISLISRFCLPLWTLKHNACRT